MREISRSASYHFDTETQEFVRIIDEFTKSSTELEGKLQAALLAGSFVAHGSYQPVSELVADVLEAAKSFLTNVAGKVFDRHTEAAYQADSGLAEKFLKTPLDRILNKRRPAQHRQPGRRPRPDQNGSQGPRFHQGLPGTKWPGGRSAIA